VLDIGGKVQIVGGSMKNLLVVLIGILCGASQAQAISCEASNRFKNSSDEIVTNTKKMQISAENAAYIILEANLDGYDYFLTYDKFDDAGMLQIVESKDTTSGLVSRSAFTKKGYMATALVVLSTVRKVECRK
jgi:hypothetical protein